MKYLGLWLVLLASTWGLQAQIKVEVKTEQDEFLSKEPLVVAVRIINHSGQVLHLGKGLDWLTFSIEGRDGTVAVQTANVPVEGEFDLESSKVATKRVDLGPYFNFGKPGRFFVTATVKIKDWSSEISSDQKSFEIIRGTKLWEQEFGVPRASTNQGPPEVRRYILQQANYARQMKLYLRLTDRTASSVMRVVAIGPMVSFSRPEPQLDQSSNLHVIYQSAARLYIYSVITPQGDLIVRQTYDVTATRPRLKTDDAGLISVLGGMRRFSSDDIPAPVDQASTDEVTTPKP